MATTKKLISFGEIMQRISPAAPYRFAQCLPGKVDITFGGAEANVAAAYTLLGGEAAFVTALPQNPIADACLANLRALGLDTSHIVRRKEGRLGLYYCEYGAMQRPSAVTYDRAYSTVSLLGAADYDWNKIFQGANNFHFSGIAPALSQKAAEATLAAVKAAHSAGLTISCDLNFRKKLWDWKSGTDAKTLARETIAQMLPFVDILIGNEEDADDMLGITAGTTDVTKGQLDIARYPEVAKKVIAKYPNVNIVAFTLRESISATHNNWGAMLYDNKSNKAHFAPLRAGQYQPYQITDIVDRVGGGDSFSGSLLYAMNDSDFADKLDECLAFAVAASCLCHSIHGDINYVSKSEVLSLMQGDASGRVKR